MNESELRKHLAKILAMEREASPVCVIGTLLAEVCVQLCLLRLASERKGRLPYDMREGPVQ